jgi:hypothetical protein
MVTVISQTVTPSVLIAVEVTGKNQLEADQEGMGDDSAFFNRSLLMNS